MVGETDPAKAGSNGKAKQIRRKQDLTVGRNRSGESRICEPGVMACWHAPAKARPTPFDYDVGRADAITVQPTRIDSSDILTGRSTVFGFGGDSAGLRPPVASSQSAM